MHNGRKPAGSTLIAFDRAAILNHVPTRRFRLRDLHDNVACIDGRGQKIEALAPVDDGGVNVKATLCDAREAALALGEDIEALGNELGEQLRTPAAAIKDDGNAPAWQQRADFSQDPRRWAASSPSQRWPRR